MNNITFSYDALGRIKTVTDKNGNATEYFYDLNGNVVETKDALGHSSYFDYDEMNRLKRTRLYRVDPRDGVVNEEQATIYQYDKRGLLKKEINALNQQVVYVYDGNGNMISKTDADGYTTSYIYDFKNMVETINYQGGKSVSYQYNKNGELVEMADWNGTTDFALDALGRIIEVNDHNNKVTAYTYDSVGNKETMEYPDNTTVTYEYDLLRRLTELTEPDDTNTGKITTTYEYDLASRLVSQQYPNGRKHEHEYDDANRLERTFEYDPTGNPVKTLGFEYSYDAQGNLLSNYRRGVGEGRVNEAFEYGYDELNRLVRVQSDPSYQHNLLHTYEYDSLSNLTFERTGNNKTVDYKHNILNQMTSKIVDNHPNQSYAYTYDNRGNLTQGVFKQNQNQVYIDEQYAYDSTNRMVLGTNDIGETSEYIFNGLGHLVRNVWTIKENAYGYTGITTQQIEAYAGEDLLVTAEPVTPYPANSKNKKDKTMTPSQSQGGGNLNKTSKVIKDYVLDYTTALKNVIHEGETLIADTGAISSGFRYRYVYGLEKLSVTISPVSVGGGSLAQNGRVKLYCHQDRLGSVDYLSDNVSGKVASYIDYDEWGAPMKKSVLKLDARELDMAVEYTGHPWDAVIGVYYARARMYDAKDKRWMAQDVIRGTVANTITLNRYVYVLDNPVNYVDSWGLVAVDLLAYTKAMGASNSVYYDYEYISPNDVKYRKNVTVSYGGVTQDFNLDNGKIDDEILNSIFGWKNSWIPNDKDMAVYLGVHGAFVPTDINMFKQGCQHFLGQNFKQM
jgi:RHS repeat-associated protein